MKWHYSGDVTVHVANGCDVKCVSGIFELPNYNVELIRNFLYENREFILSYKYSPPSGEAPWGDAASQAEMRSELNRRMSDDEWGVGTSKQEKAFLVAFYHHLLSNIDLYSPNARELVSA